MIYNNQKKHGAQQPMQHDPLAYYLVTPLALVTLKLTTVYIIHKVTQHVKARYTAALHD